MNKLHDRTDQFCPGVAWYEHVQGNCAMFGENSTLPEVWPAYKEDGEDTGERRGAVLGACEEHKDMRIRNREFKILTMTSTGPFQRMTWHLMSAETHGATGRRR